MSKVTMRRPDARAMAQLLAEQTQTAAGLILRLAWRQGLTREEIQRLTWNDVDFSAHQLRLPDRTIPLEMETEACLRRQAERPDPPTPFVVVSDRRRQQMPPESISRLARKTLDRAGLGGISLGDLCREERRENEDARLLAYAAEKGTISRSEAMSLLGLSKVAAYERLRQLAERGKLVRVGGKYYPAGQVVPPEEQYDVIRTFLEQSGPAYRQDLAALLHVGDRQCALILKHMVEDRRLVQAGQRYALPIREEVLL